MKKKKKFIRGNKKPVAPVEGVQPEAPAAPAPGVGAEGAPAPAAAPATAMGGEAPGGDSVPGMAGLPPMKKPSKKSMQSKMYGKV